MTRDHSLLQQTSREALVQRNYQALEQRWRRKFMLPPVSDAVRHDPGASADVESLQIRGRAGTWLRVHSARDPVREAARWLDDALGGADVPAAACIIGAGLGFIIDALVARSTRTRILVLEPEPATVPCLLGRCDWTDLIADGRLLILWGPEFDGASEAWRILDGEAAPLVLTHPVLTAERPEAAAAAARVLKRATTDWKANRDARDRFAGRYLLNTLRNLPLFDRTGDVATLAGRYAGVPAVIAAAGPSLNRNLEELTRVDGLRDRAVVISVDTALRTCLAAGVDPHFVVAVDPAEANARHLVNPGRCDDTWLVAEPSVDAEAFRAFHGRTLLFRIADHDPWPWLRARGTNRGLLRVWGSVLTAAVDFALQLGCNPLLLVGADLAYTNNQPYCRGTAYEADWTYAMRQGYTLEQVWAPWLKEPGFEAPDMHGVPTRSTSYLIAFRDWLADLSVREHSRRFINATGAGVLTGGAFTLMTVADAFASLPSERVSVPRPTLPSPAVETGGADPAADAAFPGVFERCLATDPESIHQWLPQLASAAAATSLGTEINAAIDQFHLRAAEQADPSAAPEIQTQIDAIKAALANVTTADEALTTTLEGWLASGQWRAWPLVERVRIIGSIGEVFLRNRSTFIRRIQAGLADIFRSTLTADLHPGLASQFYDSLFFLRWVTTEDPGDLVDFRDQVVEPMARHARAWTSRLQIAPRTAIGPPPYRIAYLSRNSRFATGDAVARVTLSMLHGHRQLASDRFRFYYYAWDGIAEDYRRDVEALGVAVRAHQWAANPCAAIARLRGALAADRIDVLLTDGNFGVPTALFASRAAPVQMYLDMGFSAWDLDSVDHNLLCFAADPQRLQVPALRAERIDYRYDDRFVATVADPREVTAQRARFADARHVFGFVGRLVKLSPDYFRAVREILERVPDAVMYLGGVGDTDAVHQAIASYGALANRVIFDARAVDGPLMFRAIDTFLDTFPFFGTLACLQAQAVGRPVVYLADRRPGYARLQTLMRDPALRADTLEDYVTLASRLATTPGEWQLRSSDTARVVMRATDTATMAAQVEDAIDRLLSMRQDARE